MLDIAYFLFASSDKVYKSYYRVLLRSVKLSVVRFVASRCPLMKEKNEKDSDDF